MICVFSLISFGFGSSELKSTFIMQQETQWLIQALEKAHYKKVSIDELNSTKCLLSYLEKLDKQKLYFTQNEVSGFCNRYSATLKTLFKQGNLLPGFEIYNAYKTNAIKRLNWALRWLEEDLKFDGNVSYNTNRDKKRWDINEDQLISSWISLVKHEVLSDILFNIDANASNAFLDSSEFANVIKESKDRVKKRYEGWIKNINEFESTDVQELYLTNLTQMFDPHTTFMNIKEKEKFDQSMNNELVGIGAVLSDVDGFCTIKELLPGGPAEASLELNPEDIILKVAQSEGNFTGVVDMKLSKIVELIKGPKDTLVRLEIRPINDPSSSKVVRIIRDKIKLTSNLAKASVHNVQHNEKTTKIGIVELRSFYGSSGNGPKATDDVEELINKLKNLDVKGIILDLRRNGGGYLSEAVNLAGLFISRGPVVQVKSTDGKIRKKFDFNPKLSWNGPLIVLVSRYSASASEIVAGALKNHKRAIIVGDESTHGKGTVQSLIQMNLPYNYNTSSLKKSAAKITIQKYYLPSGNSTQINGVQSDISMPTINTFLPIGESDLENALPCDSIPAVNFRRPVNEFVYNNNNIEKLKKYSLERQSILPEFSYLNRYVAWYKEKKNEDVVSLNFQKRFQEKKQDHNFTTQLDNQLEQLAEISFKKKDFTLDIVQSQNLKSKQIRGGEEDNRTDSFYDPPRLDIRLHESCRIMSDWITLLADKDSLPIRLEFSKEI
ncbi:MAG: carboxy terminal-processing peptidase [Opitutae bacterium]|nr:carboxy terminal-processing peptidase [Opitutae bacterium]